MLSEQFQRRKSNVISNVLPSITSYKTEKFFPALEDRERVLF